MAYSKTTWANGTTPAISADNLNKIENELGFLDGKTIENDEILKPISEGYNLFDKSNITENFRISGTGADYADGNCYISDYIPATKGKTYTKNSPTIDAYHRMAFYNSGKATLSVISDSNSGVAPQNGYVRFCGLKTEISTATLVDYKELTAIDKVARELIDIVGEYYYKELYDISSTTIGAVQTFNISFNEGDKVKLNYSVTNPGTGHLLTVVTRVNNANKDYFLQLTNTTSTGEVEIEITANSTQLNVYSTSGYVDMTFSKRASSSDLGNTIFEQVATNKDNIQKNQENIVYKTDDNIIGEAMLKNNIEFCPNEFMKIVMIDNNYKFFNVANIKRIIDKMYDVSLNYLELGFGGSGYGLSFKLDNMTFVANGKTYDINNCVITDYGNYLSETDMEEIIDYAEIKGIEIIPSLNVMSHATALLTGRPEFWYEHSSNTLDINNEEACNYAIGIAELYAKWFSKHNCHFWNMCVDEFYNYTYGYPYLQANGMYRYAEFINRIAFTLAKYRFTLLAWNDSLCANDSKVPFINRRLYVKYWAEKTGYGKLHTLVNQGYKVINASDGIYWVCNGTSVTVETMRQFDITKFSGGETYEHPIGASFCIWIGTRENPSLNDGGTQITDDVLPLIQAFGETVNSQL